MSEVRSAMPRAEAVRQIAKTLGPRRLSALYLLATFVVLFSVLEPDTFFTSTTMTVVFNAGSVTCLLALAFLIPLAAESYDLSIGATMTLGVTIVIKGFNSGMPLGLAAVIAVLACAVVGAVNGLLIVKLHVNSFIATLGVSQLLLAVVILISNNEQLVGEFPDGWSQAGNDSLLGIPYALVYVLVIAVVLWYVLEHTSVGRYLFATGGNPEAARLSGVPTRRLVWGAMVASGMISGAAGVLYSMQAGTSTPTTGTGYLFPAIAAVFLGASQLQQRPNVWGTLLAYFTLAFGIQGLSLSTGSASAWASPLFQGVALIVAVAVASRPVRQRLRGPTPEPTRETPKAVGTIQ